LGASSKLDYLISLTFSDAVSKERRKRENLVAELKKGDAAGWVSTGRYKAERALSQVKIKPLE
jgi:hypothetical protein